jgi:phenylalanyl-tRNA synthetase beta chain
MRHEKGLWHALPRYAADRAARLLVETTGARVARGIVDNDPAPPPARRITVGVSRTERLLGIELSRESIGGLLEPLGFAAEPASDDAVTVTVPDHRLDVVVAADVAEEIARSYGYARVRGRLPEAVLPPYRSDPSGSRNAVRRSLAGLGLREVVSYALIGPDALERAGYAADDAVIRVANPLSDEHSVLRPVLYPSLLGALADNERQRRGDAWLFELGKVYWYNPGQPTPRERRAETAGTGRYESWELGIILGGRPVPRSPGATPAAADVADLKGVIDALHETLGAPPPAYRGETRDERHPHRHPGRTGLICDASGHPYGSLGEVHPAVAAAWGLDGRPVDAAISVEYLLGLAPTEARARSLPTGQPIDRDLAVVVDEATPVGEVLRIARRSAGSALVDLRLFDEYRGAQAGPGRVSYALSLRFQPELAGDEKSVEKALNKVRGSLQHHLGAEIR